jgi:hypothetical protein
LYCAYIGKGQSNASKAKAHLAKKTGENVAICNEKYRKIPANYADMYKRQWEAKVQKTEAKIHALAVEDEAIQMRNDAAMEAIGQHGTSRNAHAMRKSGGLPPRPYSKVRPHSAGKSVAKHSKSGGHLRYKTPSPPNTGTTGGMQTFLSDEHPFAGIFNVSMNKLIAKMSSLMIAFVLYRCCSCCYGFCHCILYSTRWLPVFHHRKS